MRQALNQAVISAPPTLGQIARIFLRLGFQAFGGPIASMALMEREAIAQGMPREVFEGHFTICKLLPGPTATQLAISLGREFRGTRGGIIAGLGFMLPAIFMVILFAMFTSSGAILQTPGLSVFIRGLQLGTLAVILLSGWRLLHHMRWIPFAISLIAVWIYAPIEPILILAFGFLGFAPEVKSHRASEVSSLGVLISICLKGALLTFGTGLAIVPLLKGDLVDRFHLISHHQFLDGLLIGQLTPGPVLSSVAYFGFLLDSWRGAVVATIAAFLPAFILILVVLPRTMARFREIAPRFLKYSVSAVLGALFGVCLRLIFVTLFGGVFMGQQSWHAPLLWIEVAVFALCLTLGFRLRTRSPLWTLLTGGVVYSAFRLWS